MIEIILVRLRSIFITSGRTRSIVIRILMVVCIEVAAICSASAQDVKLRSTLGKHETGVIYCVVLSPDGRTLAAGTLGRAIWLWDVGSGKTIGSIPVAYGRAISAVAFSPNGKLLASAGEEKPIRLWNAKTGESSGILVGHEEDVLSLSFSPDGRTMASGGFDGHGGKLMLWDVKESKK